MAYRPKLTTADLELIRHLWVTEKKSPAKIAVALNGKRAPGTIKGIIKKHGWVRDERPTEVVASDAVDAVVASVADAQHALLAEVYDEAKWLKDRAYELTKEAGNTRDFNSGIQGYSKAISMLRQSLGMDSGGVGQGAELHLHYHSEPGNPFAAKTVGT